MEKQGQRSKALDQYRYALAFIRKIDQPDIETLVAVQNNIAGILQYQGKLLEALNIYEENLRLEPDHSSLAMTYSFIGLNLRNLDRNEEVVLYFQKTIEILSKYIPSNDPTIVKYQIFIEEFNQILIVSRS